MELIRMSAAGNAFYLGVDLPLAEPELAPLARRVCRGEGMGSESSEPAAASDGLIFGASAEPSQRMFNPDGSEGMCANGLRCLARLLADRGLFVSGESIATQAGPKRVWVRDDWVEAQLGRVRSLPDRTDSLRRPFAVDLAGQRLQGYGADVGNPHFVLLADAATQARLGELGPALARHVAFPAGVNLEIAVAGPDGFSVRVWERGVGETLSCGTGALAVASVGPNALRPGQERRLRYPGGTLLVRMDEAGLLYLSGRVRREGRYELRDMDAAAQPVEREDGP